MWYAVYETETGALVSIGTVIADPLPGGLSVVETANDPSAMAWDKVTHTFSEVKQTQTRMSKVEFMRLFTMQERIAIRSSTDPVIMDILWLINNADIISLLDEQVQQGIGYSISVGLLTPERGANVLSGVSP